MKYTFNTVEVRELARHMRDAKKHTTGDRGLLYLVKDDGVYIRSPGLPKLLDSKNDEKVAFAKSFREVGNFDKHDTWTHAISGAWIEAILNMRDPQFTIVRRNKTMHLVGGDKLHDDEASGAVASDKKPKKVKAPREPKAPKRSLPDSYSSLGVVVALANVGDVVGTLTAKKARIMLRKAKKKPAAGWAWTQSEVADIVAFLRAEPAPKASRKGVGRSSSKARRELLNTDKDGYGQDSRRAKAGTKRSKEKPPQHSIPGMRKKFKDVDGPAIMKKLEDTMNLIYAKWSKEKTKADIVDYSRIISKKLPKGHKFVEMTKKPFGFKFSANGRNWHFTFNWATMMVKPI